MITILQLTIFLTLYVETTFSWNLNFNSHRSDSHDGYQKKNVLPSDGREEYDDMMYARTSNSIPSLHHHHNHNRHNTKTRYYYKTHQSATISLPSRQRGNQVNVGPDEDETRSYMTRIDSTNIGSPRSHARRPREQDEDDFHGVDTKPFFRTGKLCIKCPPEKILIAKRGLDGVHVDIPQLTTCNDRPISRSVYELETLFSKKHHFILPRGSHSFIGQVVNKKNFSVEHVCNLKYKIIVRSCGSFIPQNENVKVKCDKADLWGSICTFSCKHNNGILTHKEPVICNDNLQWHGAEPDCIVQHRDYFKKIEGAISSCQLPSPPEHAKFSCKVNRDLVNEHENELFIPDGTICKIKCARFYEIPEQYQRNSAFVCKIGRFNYTHYDNFCTKIQLKKFT